MTDPVDSVDIAVTGSPAAARDTVAAALIARKFTVSWVDDWNGTATRGHKATQFFLGGLAPYFEVGLTVFDGGTSTIVRITRPSSGITGGLAGRMRVKKQYNSLCSEVSEVFRVARVLLPPPVA
jgi:hypothetical protein